MKVRWPAPRLGEHGAEPWPDRQAPKPAAPATPPAKRGHPLDGVKVLDLGAFLAGPMAPSLLGDMGADVIKVEGLDGDRMRFMVRYFHAAQRSKRSIAVDLTKPEGQEVLHRLIRWSDIVHHNMRLRAAAKLGLDEASVKRIKILSMYLAVWSPGRIPGINAPLFFRLSAVSRLLKTSAV